MAVERGFRFLVATCGLTLASVAMVGCGGSSDKVADSPTTEARSVDTGSAGPGTEQDPTTTTTSTTVPSTTVPSTTTTTIPSTTAPRSGGGGGTNGGGGGTNGGGGGGGGGGGAGSSGPSPDGLPPGMTYGMPCEVGSHADCIDPEGDGQGVLLQDGAFCMYETAASMGPEICLDLDGDGKAGYPDAG